MAKIHPWPAAIIAYFSIVLCGVVFLVMHALKNNVELVRTDYYEQEVKYQDQIDRIKRTEPFMSEINVAYLEQRLEVKLPLTHAASEDFSGVLWIYRPSNAGLDQKLELKNEQKESLFSLNLDLEPGFWRIKADWKAGGEEYFFEESLVVGTM